MVLSVLKTQFASIQTRRRMFGLVIKINVLHERKDAEKVRTEDPSPCCFQ
jgi:hypothetical protein